MKRLQKLLLLLVLLVAGVQSAWAQTWECWTSYTKDGITYNMNRLLEQGQNTIWSPQRATIASITATGDVTIPYYDGRYDYWVSDIGWDYESQTAVDINCTSYLTSLTIDASQAPMGESEIFTIHGTFSLENLYGPLAFREHYSSTGQHEVCTIIAQGAWIKIPHATSISYKNLQVDGFIEANAISSLTVPLIVSETGLIQAHTAKTVTVPKNTTISGIVQAPKATKVVVSSNTSIMETGQIIVDAPKNVEIKGGDFFGTFRSDSLTKITLGQVDFGISGKLRCPMLTDIYIPDKNKIPNFIGYYSERFTAPQNTITVHVYDMSPSEIASMKNSAVWNGFKEVVSHKSEVKATLSSNGGGEVQLWKKTGTNSQMQYTMSSNGGEEIVTLYDNADSYQIRLYYDNANYETPVLRRNGVEVSTTDSGNGYCYYNETDHMNVNRYSVSYNMKVYRKLHIVNLGNGRVRLTGLIDGVEKAFTINGAADLYYGFDNTRYVGVEITPEEGYEVQRIKLYGRIPISFSTNATTGITTTQYYFTDEEKEQSLYVYYKKKTIPDGTSFNVHMSVEGTLGIGAVFFDDDGDYDWSDSDIESNDFSYQMDPGGSENVIGIYHPADGPTMGFSVVSYLSAEEIAAGFTCTVKVYSNRGEVVSSSPSEWGGDHYSIPLDGTDTDVRVVFETNGRYIRGNNGDGGTVEIYCEGDDTPSSITESGFWFYPILPKTGNPYAVITPQEGKTVTAILRDGSLLSPSAFLQSDGTYRVPLQDFDRGDSYYEIYIIYSDDMAVVESTGITWSGIAMGEKLEDANMFEVMLNDDATNYRIFTSQGTTSSTFNQKFDDDVSSLKVNLIVKDGYDFKVYFNGEEFPHTFTKSTLNAEQGLFLYSFETTNVATIIPFLVDGTWVVEFKKPAGITWSAVAMGAQNYLFSVQYDGDPVIPNLDSENHVSFSSGQVTPEQVQDISGLYVMAEPGYTFDLTFNGINLNGVFGEGTLCTINGKTYYEYQMTDAITDYKPILSTDGTWVVEFKKATDIIEFADNNVKAICVAHWDTNGDGELSKTEAAAVTTLRVLQDKYASPFKNNTEITSFDELQYFTGLTEIADSAFYDCRALKSLKLPQQITSLNKWALYNCQTLEEIQLPNGLKTIGEWAFRYCSSLRTFFVPASVTSIPNHVLGGCSGLHAVVVDPANTKYDSRNGCNAIIETNSNTVIDGCRNTVLPEGITRIGGFQSQTELTTFVIPSTVTYIGSADVTYAFSGCSHLEKIVSKAKVPFGRSYECFKRFADNCVLIVPYGTRQAYINAGFSETVFKGGIVEDKSQFDTNGDGSVSIADVTTLVNVILGKPIQ